MKQTQFDQWLENAAQELPRQRQPRHDLWFGIEAKIKPRRRFWPLPAAAAVLALGLALSFWFKAGPPVTQLRPESPAANLLATAQMERKYRDALLEVLARQGPINFTGPRRDQLEAGLQQIEQAQTQIRDALARQPKADFLRALLRQTHIQRLELIKHLGEYHAKTIT